MRKVNFSDAGLEVVDAPDPVVMPGRLLVRTQAVGVGVGLLRLLAAAGGRAEPVRPGGEIVGTVVAVGAGVSGFQVGDRVGGVVFEDAYADLVLTDPRLVARVPREVEATAAVCLVRGGLIALSALRAGRFAPGESILVTAAASGTGHLAVQLGRALGAARVVAAVGSPDKAAFARDCGADGVVTYAEPSWGEPVDLVLDAAGGDLVPRGVDTLAPFGRMVAFSAGGGTVDVASLLGGMKSVIGFTIGTLNRTRPDLVDQHRAELWELLAGGALHPRRVEFGLDEIAAAVALVASRGNLGRVVVTTGDHPTAQTVRQTGERP
ncbi:zinc-binding alcohol dehydrogenase family protein [Micromonospora sp. NPDC048930]|uniref:quinone oxidoreductase family protein n=1 Tax=Micromonospora sp. NPDC048930 TaxID=3364261 RepID=UPI003718ED96